MNTVKCSRFGLVVNFYMSNCDKVGQNKAEKWSFCLILEIYSSLFNNTECRSFYKILVDLKPEQLEQIERTSESFFLFFLTWNWWTMDTKINYFFCPKCLFVRNWGISVENVKNSWVWTQNCVVCSFDHTTELARTRSRTKCGANTHIFKKSFFKYVWPFGGHQAFRGKFQVQEENDSSF